MPETAKGGIEAARSETPRPAAKILYIAASMRSGSTLLLALLGLQPGFCAVGEICRVGELLAEGRPCGCGAPIAECPLWRRIAERLGAPFSRIRTDVVRTGIARRVQFGIEWGASIAGIPRLAGWLLGDQAEAARNTFLIHRLVAEETGCRVTVDSSKGLPHFLQLHLLAPETVVPVFLVRDGRGVLWSRINRTNVSPEWAIRSWLRSTRLQLALRRRFPGTEGELVRYEDLCRAPAATLGRIVAPLGLDGRTTNLEDLAGSRHDLGGSPRFSRTIPESIELDERWRSEMPAQLAAEFERRAGWANRAIGYE